jgi:hypothetical protein
MNNQSIIEALELIKSYNQIYKFSQNAGINYHSITKIMKQNKVDAMKYLDNMAYGKRQSLVESLTKFIKSNYEVFKSFISKLNL